MQLTSCGLDFGTSNSTLAVTSAGKARLIALEAGHPTIPSAVFWDAEGAAPLFGRAAIAAYTSGEDGRLMRGLKSTLGTPLIHEKTRIGNRVLTFQEIIGRFFQHMQARLMAETDGRMLPVVLGRPVHFVDGDPKADAAAQDVLRTIARAQGFTQIAFQYEPIAAALHYEQGVSREELVLIVDIGGGTSDFSIVRVAPERARKTDRQSDILANDGTHIGGTDFDRLLSLRATMPQLGLGSEKINGKGPMPRHYFIDLATWHRINLLYTDRALADLKALRKIAEQPKLLGRMISVVEKRHGHSLAMAAEAAKIALAEDEHGVLQIAPFTGGPNVRVRRAAFERVIAPAIARIQEKLSEVLTQAGLNAGDIGTVFMTGGSSSLPVLRASVQAVLPGVPIATGDLLGSVGTGLALDGARKFGG
ncbi:Hsp70 family protein [Phaeovulum sp.]|uniref:Hsp70 family protein n=1 Tax=Phaeovulum sp. TaxID=2934796 RepID=UPI0039E5011A